MAKHSHKKPNVPAHLRFMTQFTKTGIMDYNNYKPFRTAFQKKVARATAEKVNGTWSASSAPRSVHPWNESMSKGVGRL